MGLTEIIAEALGFVAIIIGFLIFQQKTKSSVLATKLSADILWIVHFLMIGATSGMIVSIVGVARSLTFLVLSFKGKSGNKFLPVGFAYAGVIAIILSWKNVYSICSIISCILATIAYWQKKPQLIKAIGFFVCITQIIYAIFVNSLSVMINECISLLSILIYFIRYFIIEREKKKGIERMHDSY